MRARQGIIVKSVLPNPKADMRLLLPFFDDSSLIFAVFLADMLDDRGHEVVLCDTAARSGALSARQRATHLGARAVRTAPSLIPVMDQVKPDAVITSKATPEIKRHLADMSHADRRGGPCWVAFMPGLEFTPETGIRNRIDFDAVFTNTVTHRDLFQRIAPPRSGRVVSFGHPYFRHPDIWRGPDAAGRPGPGDIVFFPQAISPVTKRGRIHMLRVLDAIARANPDRRVVIKLRHLPGENARHSHRELHAYPDLAKRLRGGVARNVAWASGTMADALSGAACAITCTSTAAMDAIAAGVPTAVHTQYVEAYRDPLSAPMRREFAGSGIDLPLRDLLDLRIPRPDPTWMAERFRGDDLYDELEAIIGRFATLRS